MVGTWMVSESVGVDKVTKGEFIKQSEKSSTLRQGSQKSREAPSSEGRKKISRGWCHGI